MTKLLHGTAKWFVAICVPFALIMLGVRLLLTPLYLQFEYRMPGFPPDDYGFTAAQRLQWGTYGINYLTNNEPASYLGDLRIESGRPVFTSREVSHMEDVKKLVLAMLRWWYISLGVLLSLGVWAWKADWVATYRAGLRTGGFLTLALAVTAALLGTLGASGSGDLFWEFFSGFHGLFFSGESWLFAYSDTLIRLYPIRFWQDTLLYLGGLAATGATSLVIGLRERRGEPAA